MPTNIGLGSAQFGLDYGVSNHSGEVSKEEVKRILKTAQLQGVNFIDTAVGYGTAEQKLGAYNLNNFKIITKSAPIKNQSNDTWFSLKDIRNSIKRLSIRKLYGFLIHNVNCLAGTNSQKIYKDMQCAKENGLIEKFGYSVYYPEDLDKFFEKFPPDIVQLPANIFDQRFNRSGWLKKLEDQGVEIHIRSVFLQGLLLQSNQDYHPYFNLFKPALDKWQTHWQHHYKSPLEACLAPFSNLPSCYSLIVGVETAIQLNSILESINKHYGYVDTEEFEVFDPRLIDPSLWHI